MTDQPQHEQGQFDLEDIMLPGESLVSTLRAMRTEITQGFHGVNEKLDQKVNQKDFDHLAGRVSVIEARNHDQDIVEETLAKHKESLRLSKRARWGIAASLLGLVATYLLILVTVIH